MKAKEFKKLLNINNKTYNVVIIDEAIGFNDLKNNQLKHIHKYKHIDKKHI